MRALQQVLGLGQCGLRLFLALVDVLLGVGVGDVDDQKAVGTGRGDLDEIRFPVTGDGHRGTQFVGSHRALEYAGHPLGEGRGLQYERVVGNIVGVARRAGRRQGLRGKLGVVL